MNAALEISGFNFKSVTTLREISNKRCTYKAVLDSGETVIIKGFYHASRKHFIKERLMHNKLAKSFNVPALLKEIHGHPVFSGGILLYEFVSDASLATLLKGALNSQLLFVISDVVRVLDKLGQLEITHHDPHFSNFLIGESGKVTLLDLSALSFSRAHDSVSLFFAQFPLRQAQQVQFLNAQHYNEERVLQFYNKRKQQLYKKVLRPCTMISKFEQDAEQLLVNNQNNPIEAKAEFETLVQQLDLTSRVKIKQKQNPFFPWLTKTPLNHDLKINWQALHWLNINELTTIKPLAIAHDKAQKSTTLWLDVQSNALICNRFSLLNPDEKQSLGRQLSIYGVTIDETK